MRHILLLFLLFGYYYSYTQFSPEAGMPGSIAIHADSSTFMNWAKQCYVTRGPYDIINMTDSLASYGSPQDATDKADGNAVSLGDGGYAVLRFNPPISDGNGFDFAVFENSFDGHFLELAFVEVSSDSINWHRFDAVSLTPYNIQVLTFGTIETVKINNLAGKFRIMYGTPFDLSELHGISTLNTDSVCYVKITDAVGCVDQQYASYDSHGNIINDPYPTPFFTGGFDLDAAGVINEKPYGAETLIFDFDVKIYPNPVRNYLIIESSSVFAYKLTDIAGSAVISGNSAGFVKAELSHCRQGIYFLTINTGKHSYKKKIVIM